MKYLRKVSLASLLVLSCFIVAAEAVGPYGMDIIEPMEFNQLVKSGSPFYLYLENEEFNAKNRDISAAIASVIQDYVVPITFTNILGDSPIMKETPKEELASFAKIVGSDYMNQAVLYAFNKGTIVKKLDLKTLDLNDSIKRPKTLRNAIISFIYRSDLFVDDHGMQLITYDAVREKIKQRENFILYVGRDSCIDCYIFHPSFLPVVSKVRNDLRIPMYYLYTQSFKTAIDEKVDGAQKTWDNLKEYLGIDGTPSLVVYNGGEVPNDKNQDKPFAVITDMFVDYVDENYKSMSRKEQIAEQDRVKDNLFKWFGAYTEKHYE